MERHVGTIIYFIISIFLIDICASDRTLNTVVVPAEYNKTYQRFSNSSIEYIFLYREVETISLEGAKIFVESNDAKIDDPLIVVVKQKRGTLSWEIPMYVETSHNNGTLYSRTSRNLCPSKYFHTMGSHHTKKNAEPEIFVRITISTASNSSISFNLTLLPVLNFYLRSGDSRNITIGPSEPVYYGYKFDNSLSNVLVTVKSQYKQNVCMTFAIGPMLNQDYPHGFFIILTVDPNIETCSEDDIDSDREKNVTLSVTEAMSALDYLIPTLVPLAIFIGFSVIYVIVVRYFEVHRPPMHLQVDLANEQQMGTNDRLNETGNEDPIGTNEAIPRRSINNISNSTCDVNSVRDLLPEQGLQILRKNSQVYLYNLLIVAAFYVVPVIQLVLNYEKMLRLTGNQDLCYYNFFCSHPLYIFSDFNHIFSNIGYLLFGALFMSIVYMRARNDILCHENANDMNPRQYGLFYAMGSALMMEGVLSASYHVCPNHDNFQFDTSFMYIIAVLCIMKIYQNRHPGITAEAHVTFGGIAITVILVLASVVGANERYFWISFTIIHISSCWLLSLKIYYMKKWRVIRKKLYETVQALRERRWPHITQPHYPKRLLFIMFLNLCNIALAFLENFNVLKMDFPTYLLTILMINLIIYITHYIFMKKRKGEKILLQPLIHIFLSMISWTCAIYFFQAQSLSFSDTPAKARENDRPCDLWNFYDYHDIWHFLSSLAMFFSFMMLLTLDDDLRTSENGVF